MFKFLLEIFVTILLLDLALLVGSGSAFALSLGLFPHA